MLILGVDHIYIPNRRGNSLRLSKKLLALLSGLDKDEETHKLLSNTERVHREARELEVRPKFNALARASGVEGTLAYQPTVVYVLIVTQPNQNNTRPQAHIVVYGLVSHTGLRG